MSNEKNSNIIRPFAGDHAIVEVSFGFEWESPLSQELLAKLSSLHDLVENDFPVKREIRQEISVEVTGTHGHNGEKQTRGDGISTILLDYVEGENSLIRQIVIEQKRLIFNDFGKYDGWVSVCNRAMAWLLPFLNIIFAERALRIVGLQYLDSFEVLTDAPVAPLVFERNDFLPEGVFGRLGAWHLHQGYFTELTAPVACMMLTNLNIRIFRIDQDKQILEVRTSHRAHFDSELLCGSEKLRNVQDALHLENKALLAKILLPQIKQAINLDNQET